MSEHGITPVEKATIDKKGEPMDHYREYQRAHAVTPIDRPFFGPEYRPLLGPEYRGPIFDWDSSTYKPQRRVRYRYIPPEIPDPYVHRLGIEHFREPEYLEPYVYRLGITMDEEFQREKEEERQRRYEEWSRRKWEKTSRRRRVIRNTILYTYEGVIGFVKSLIGSLLAIELTTTQKTYSYLMERLRSLIEEEEVVVSSKVEIMDEAPPDVRPSLLDNDGIDVAVIRKEIDDAKEYERQQIERIIRENEEYRDIRDNLKSLDLRIRDLPDKPQSDEELSRLKQLQRDKEDALEKRRKLDARKEKRERDELVEIERIEKRVREEKERLSYLRRKASSYGVLVPPPTDPVPTTSPVLSSDEPWYDLWDRVRGYLGGSITTRTRRYRPRFGPVRNPRRYTFPMFGPRNVPYIVLYRSVSSRLPKLTSVDKEYVDKIEGYIRDYVVANPNDKVIYWYSVEDYITSKMRSSGDGSVEYWRSRIDLHRSNMEKIERGKRELEERSMYSRGGSFDTSHSDMGTDRRREELREELEEREEDVVGRFILEMVKRVLDYWNSGREGGGEVDEKGDAI